MTDHEFYIGWQPKAPDRISRSIRLSVIVLALLVPVIAFLIVSSQQDFSEARFEYGKSTSMTGILRTTPAPFLQVYHGTDMEGQRIHQNILLVAPGKHGIAEMLASREQTLGHSLHGKAVTLKGFLIYHGGKTLLEVEDMDDIEDTEMLQDSLAAGIEYGEGAFIGEITDPKCLFGVMKPGSGKPHRSCAARCIAGGIPPVLRTTRNDGSYQYYLMADDGNASINHEVLPFAGDQVAMCGRVEKLGDWLIFYKSTEKPILLLNEGQAESLAMCGE